jgi:hypothetical protein
MDEKLEKAMQTANYMATLNTQKKIALEEFRQSLVYYHDGASFIADRELINFIKALIDLEYTQFIVLDDNNIPVEITDLKLFLESLLDVYKQSANDYIKKYKDLKKKRKVEDLVIL